VARDPVVKGVEPCLLEGRLEKEARDLEEKEAEPVVKAAEPVVKAAEPVVKAAEPVVKEVDWQAFLIDSQSLPTIFFKTH
jgi:hypothetical protein